MAGGSTVKVMTTNFGKLDKYGIAQGRTIMEQLNELLRILGQYTLHGLKMDESICVSSVIDKLPPSLKDFKHSLKHGKKRGLNDNNGGSGSNKKPKVACWKCDETGHFKNDSRSGNKKDNARASGSGEGSKDHSQDQGQKLMLLRGGLILVSQLMFEDHCWLLRNELVEDVPGDSGSVYMCSSTVANSLLWHARLGHRRIQEPIMKLYNIEMLLFEKKQLMIMVGSIVKYNTWVLYDVNQEKEEIDLEDIFQIQDVILREKLLNINRLITNIESLNDNPTPDRVLKSHSPFPIPDSNSFFEKSDTSLSYSDNSLPEFEVAPQNDVANLLIAARIAESIGTVEGIRVMYANEVPVAIRGLLAIRGDWYDIILDGYAGMLFIGGSAGVRRLRFCIITRGGLK
ncbi:zinc finger, CCHC-type containing protein [Tanacetum coccineum]